MMKNADPLDNVEPLARIFKAGPLSQGGRGHRQRQADEVRPDLHADGPRRVLSGECPFWEGQVDVVQSADVAFDRPGH